MAAKRLLEKDSIVILLGTGGVGKTTIAASLGLASAMRELNTALITFDPARRLRDALGLEKLGGRPTPLDLSKLRTAGLDPRLKIAAMQLDVKGAWDQLVEQFIADPGARKRILENPFYKSLTEQFAGSESYAALEQLYNLHNASAFESLVVDTPPAAHAFEFLQAPARLVRLLDSRAARWLFMPYMSASRFAMRLASRAARFVVRELERFAGANVLTSISEFFIAAAEAVDGVVDRLKKTETLLRSPAVKFVMVTTAEEDRLAMAEELVSEMRTEKLNLSAIVINRFLDEQTWVALSSTKTGPPDSLQEIDQLLEAAGKPASGNGTAALLDFYDSYARRTREDIERVAKFARNTPESTSVLVVPELQIGVGDLKSLVKIAGFLFEKPVSTARLEKALMQPRRGNGERRSSTSTREKAPE